MTLEGDRPMAFDETQVDRSTVILPSRADDVIPFADIRICLEAPRLM